MDKYQEDLIKGVRFICCDVETINTMENPFQNDLLKIVQDEDITHTKYFIYLEQSKIVSKIEVCKNQKYENLAKKSLKTYSGKFKFNREEFVMDFDFNTKEISKIKIHFINDLADPLEIPIEYVEADKEKYNEKLKIQLQKELTEKANVTVKTGDSIINVNFQPVNESYVYSKVELYLTDTKIGANTNPNYQLMAKYKTEEDVYFHSISGIAYGKYAIVLIQYDKENNEIYKSDYISVFLKGHNYS